MKKLSVIFAMLLAVLLLVPGTAFADAAAGGEHNFQSADYYVQVDAWDGYVNFRYGPGLEYGINTPIYNGEVLHVTRTADNYFDGLHWGQVQYNGDYGWISLSEVSPYEQSPGVEPHEAEYYSADYYVRVSASDGYCNLRTGPGLAFEIITPVSNGNDLHILQEAKNLYDGLWWGQCSYNGNLGWVSLSQTSNIAAPVAPEEPTTQKENTEQNSNRAEDYVSERYSNTVQKDSSVYSYKIPQFDLDSDAIRTLNQEIYEHLNTEIQTAVNELSRDGYTMNLLESSYQAYQYGDIVSLVILRRYGGPWHEYDVYNVSISQKKTLSKEEVLQAVNLSEQAYEAKAAATLNLAFWKLNYHVIYHNQTRGDDYYKQKAETASAENIAKATPYINNEGELCMIASVLMYQVQVPTSWEPLNLIQEVPGNGYFVVVDASDNYCNLRKGAGTDQEILTPIYNGTVLQIFKEENAGGLNWGRTTYNGEEGWVSLSQTRTVIAE